MRGGPAPLLEVIHASKLYGGLRAVGDVSFSMEAGEIVGLIGPNGAGKTTLVNLITHTERMSSGEIRFDGQRISDRPPHDIGRLGIARTFQTLRPFRSMTVMENVAVGAFFGASLSKRSRYQAMAKAQEVLSELGLAEKRNYRVDSLTVQDRKLLEMAKALAMEPRLLLLDEVMAGLTGSEIDDVMGLVRKLNSQGVTILAIEHVMKTVMGISQRIIVMDHGQLIASGTPEQVASDMGRVLMSGPGREMLARDDIKKAFLGI